MTQLPRCQPAVAAIALLIVLTATAGSAGADPFRPAVSELLYVPIEPCKIIDLTSSTKLASDDSRAFHVTGMSGFRSQGGEKDGCGIPDGAVSVAISLALKTATSKGYINGGPLGAAFSPQPLLMFQANTPIVNNVIQTLGTGGKIKLVSKGASSKITAYATGYYVEQPHGLIYTGSSVEGGYIFSGSKRIVSVTRISTGVADVTFDGDFTYCTPVVTAYFGTAVYASALTFNGNRVRVSSWLIDSNTHVVIPADNYVYVGVKC